MPPILLLADHVFREPARLPVPSWRDVGWQRISQTCLGIQIVLFAASLLLYRVTGIEVQWSSGLDFVALIGAFLVAWIVIAALGSRRVPMQRAAEALAAATLFLLLLQITAPIQYGALALGRPFIDAWLDQTDRRLGIDVLQVTAWTAHYPWLVSTLNWTYNTLPIQLVIPLIVLPVAGDRRALWEYLWHLHVSLVVALICLALWPALCPFTYRHYEPLVSPVLLEHLTTQIREVHAGRFRVIVAQDMQGLISFPSFHVAAALAVTWALRRQRVSIWLPIALINVGLVLATVLLGIHYATDLLGTAVLLAASLVIYRRWYAPPGIVASTNPALRSSLP